MSVEQMKAELEMAREMLDYLPRYIAKLEAKLQPPAPHLHLVK